MALDNKNINNRKDIELLVNSFYDKVRKDELIGFIFNDIIGDDWSKHLPIMYSFWETVLFAKAGYQGNPVKKHVEIDKKIKLQKPHYDKWLQLWTETIDSLFTGEVADRAKEKATTMMQLIDFKVTASRSGKSIL